MNTELEDDNDDLTFQAAENEIIALTVPVALAGMRLDAAIAKMLPDYSRSRITAWIKDG